MKKLFSILTLIVVFLGFSILKTEAKVTDDNSLSVKKLAVMTYMFMGNIIENESENKWDENTIIEKVIPLFDVNETLVAYTLYLSNNGNYNGYITISNIKGENSVLEYSDSSYPIFNDNTYLITDKVYTNGPFEYYIKTKENKLKFKGLDEKTKNINVKLPKENKLTNLPKKSKTDISKNEMIDFVNDIVLNDKKLRFSTENWYLGYDGQSGDANGSYGGIYDVYSYLKNRYGSGYTLIRSKNLSVEGILMTEFDADNHCSLTAITTVLNYYRSIGYTAIPNDIHVIFNDVYNLALNNGYTPKGGTNPTLINNIIQNAYLKYGYKNAHSYNDYILSENDVFSEINANRPLIFNIANGYYSNHSVTVYGYMEFDGPKWYSFNKEFFKVHDGWTKDTRYIDWDAWGTFGSFTKSAPYKF